MDDFDRAGELQRSVKWREIENLAEGLDQYSDEEARQAIVHARQDIVSIVSLLASLNGHARTIKWLAFFIALILAALIYKAW